MQSVTIIKTKTAREYRAIERIKMHPWRHVFLSLLLANFPTAHAEEIDFSFLFSSEHTAVPWTEAGPSHSNLNKHL